MHTLGLVRTTITLPEDVLARVDEVAGPRGRSAYIADVVARQVRRDHGRKVFAELAGVLKGSTTWGETAEETDRILRETRDSWDRDEAAGEGLEGEGEIPAGHDRADRSRPRAPRGAGARHAAVQRAE
jgi:hypothetical protein